MHVCYVQIIKVVFILLGEREEISWLKYVILMYEGLL